jgi:hypothetical protein
MTTALKQQKTVQLDAVLWAKVQSIDLEQVWLQLVHREGFSRKRATAAVDSYRKFLYLCGTRQFTSLSPDPVTDAAWHKHLLMTEKYEADCDTVFGFRINHCPTFIDPAQPIARVKKKGEVCDNTPDDGPGSCKNSCDTSDGSTEFVAMKKNCGAGTCTTTTDAKCTTSIDEPVIAKNTNVLEHCFCGSIDTNCQDGGGSGAPRSEKIEMSFSKAAQMVFG